MIPRGKRRDGHKDPPTGLLRAVRRPLSLVESVMKSRNEIAAEDELRKAKDKVAKRLQKRMRDPTLEGKDETKVGRIPERIASVD